jgi:anti-sigma factor RsiW
MCPFDLKEYALGESPREEALRIEAHLGECGACREEVARLQLTGGALLTLADEEPPRRIAFVSDRVFEPRWYHRLWNSAPRLGFIAAAMLACAILVHAFARPPAAPFPVAAADAQTIDQRIEREVTARVNTAVGTAVAKAVADSEARQQKRTAELLKAADERYELDRRATLTAFSEQTRIVQKQLANIYMQANNLRAAE